MLLLNRNYSGLSRDGVIDFTGAFGETDTMFTDMHTHPFYRPLWRRLAIVGSIAAWTAVELFYSQSPFWSMLAVALLLYCTWVFLITYPKPSQED
jgi:hypothetical protein